MNGDNSSWTVIIKPNERMPIFSLRELKKNRDLIFLFVRRNITVAYKQTLLGILWFLIPSVISVFVYLFVFNDIMNLSTSGIPAPLFYLFTLTVWNFFSNSLISISYIFEENSSILKKVYFPSSVLCVQVMVTQVIFLLVQLALLACFYLYFVLVGYDIGLTFGVLLFPFLILLVSFLSLGIGMIVASITIKYRDILLLLNFSLLLWMYVSPVVYPLSSVTDSFVHSCLLFNPMTPIIEIAKYSLFGVLEVSGWWIFYSIGIAVILFIMGKSLFSKSVHVVVDYA